MGTMAHKWYKYYTKRFNKTRQAINADCGREARLNSGNKWGGRYMDGVYDRKRKPSAFSYHAKSAWVKGTGNDKRNRKRRKVYYYTLKERKGWKSFKISDYKKYAKKRKSKYKIERFK